MGGKTSTSWKPGESGNPEGSRRKRIVKQCLDLALSPDEYKRLRDIVEKNLTLAEGGDLAAIKEIYDRLDGKVPQAQIHQGDEDGGPIEHVTRVEIVAASGIPRDDSKG